jgi:hypothetical protein
MPWKVHHEENDHFVVHGNGGPFRIGKQKLSPSSLAKMRALCKGGKVKKLAEGGDVEPQHYPNPEAAKNPPLVVPVLERPPQESTNWPAMVGSEIGGAVGRTAGLPAGPVGVVAGDLAGRTVGAHIADKAVDEQARFFFPSMREEPEKQIDLRAMLETAKAQGPWSVAQFAVHGIPGESLTSKSLRTPRVTPTKTLADIPWEGVPVQEGIGKAREGVHLKQDKSGQFAGAPRGTTSMEDIEALRQKRVGQIGEVADVSSRLGESGGADWYPRDAETVQEVSPNDPMKFAKGLAIYSPQTSPGPNEGWAIGNWNQLRGADPGYWPAREGMQKTLQMSGKGSPDTSTALDRSLTLAGSVRTRQSSNKFADMWLDPGGDLPGGTKVNTFTRDLAEPNRVTSQPTSDLHTGRSAGYPGKGDKPFERGFTPEEHSVLAATTNILLDDLAKSNVPPPPGGWTKVNRAQAAEWIASKVRTDLNKNFGGAPLDMLSEADQRMVLKRAREGFTDHVNNYTAHMTVEATPSDASKHLAGMPNALDADKEAYTNKILGPGGSPVLRDLDMLERRSGPGTGLYQTPAGTTESNPSRTFNPLASYKKGSSTEVAPDAARALDLAAAVHGYLGVQEGVPWHMVKLEGANKGNAVRLHFPEQLSPDQTRALYSAVEKIGDKKLGLALDDTGGGSFTLTSKAGPHGMRGTAGKAQFSKLLQQLHPDVFAGAEQKLGGYTGNYISTPWSEEQGTGRATDAMLNAMRKARPEDLALLQEGPHTRAWAKSLISTDAATANPKLGIGAPRPDVQKARGIWATEGPEGLARRVGEKIQSEKARTGKVLTAVEAAASLGLPAVALGYLGNQDQEQQKARGGKVEKMGGRYAVREEPPHFIIDGGEGGPFSVHAGNLSPAAVQGLRRMARGGLTPKNERAATDLEDYDRQIAMLGPEAENLGHERPASRAEHLAALEEMRGNPSGQLPSRGGNYPNPDAAANPAEPPGPGPGYPNPDAAGNPEQPPSPGYPNPDAGANPQEPPPEQEANAWETDTGGAGQTRGQIIRGLSKVFPIQNPGAGSPPEQTPPAPPKAPQPAAGATPTAQAQPASMTDQQPPASPFPEMPPEADWQKVQSQLDTALQAGNEGARLQAEAQAQRAKELTNAYSENTRLERELESRRVADTQSAQNQIDKQINDVMSTKIDPTHFWSSKGAFSKVAAGLGMILSGMGAGLTGQPNMAAQFLQRQIDRDIDRQKLELGTKQNLLGYMYKKYGNIQEAALAARSHLMASLAGEVGLASARAGGTEAQANAELLKSHLATAALGAQAQIISGRHQDALQRWQMFFQQRMFQQFGQRAAEPGYIPSGTRPPIPTEISLKGISEAEKADGEMRVYLPEVGPQAHTYAPPHVAQELNKTFPAYLTMERGLQRMLELGKKNAWSINSPWPTEDKVAFESQRDATNLGMNTLFQQQRFTPEENKLYGPIVGDAKTFLLNGSAGAARIREIMAIIKSRRLADYQRLGIPLGERPPETPLARAP